MCIRDRQIGFGRPPLTGVNSKSMNHMKRKEVSLSPSMLDLAPELPKHDVLPTRDEIATERHLDQLLEGLSLIHI